MNRIKAQYRSCGISCSSAGVYAPRRRPEWLATLVEPRVRVGAEHLYQQLDGLQPVRLEARRELPFESHKHQAVRLLRRIPSIGPIRAPCWWRCCRHPHRFCTNASSGPTAASPSRLMTGNCLISKVADSCFRSGTPASYPARTSGTGVSDRVRPGPCRRNALELRWRDRYGLRLRSGQSP
jgi:hypothetical protein